jgi:transcriptional regulator GlxA family with amidase domain
MLSNVVAVAVDGVAPFELGVVCEVFGIDRRDQGLPAYDFAVVAGEPGPIRTSIGFTIETPHGLDRIEQADLVAVPAAGDRDWPEALLESLRRTVERGARVMSVCTGAFALGQAGLLDGRRCTTHWMHVEKLAAQFPRAKVDRDVLYVEDDGVLTSAGTAAGIDLCLHIVRQDQGAVVANAIARRMVVPPFREGGQAQFVETPVPQPRRGDSLEEVLVWASSNLHREITVELLAGLAHMSPRTFARRFRAETGTTPHRWITGQRVALAQRLLEETDETVDLIADRTGFGSAANLRHHFTNWVRTTPQAYRATFSQPQPLALPR